MNSTLSDFTKKFDLSKTLRFELKPCFDTEEKFIGLEAEKQRAEAYPKAKEVLDMEHRKYIEETLSKIVFNEKDLNELLEAEKGKDYKKVSELRKKLKKQIMDSFDKKITTKSIMERFDPSSKEEREVLKHFKKFYTYFRGYEENRENIYKDKKGSVASRLIEDNLPRFFFNVNLIKNIKKTYPELYADISESTKDIDSLAGFNNFISQKGIDKYNSLIGAESEEAERKDGINQKINSYRQKQKIKNKELPCLISLYKQILSDRDRGFITLLQSEEDLRSEVIYVKNTWNEKNINNLKDFLGENITEKSADKIFIKKDSLPYISSVMFGSWSKLCEEEKSREKATISLKALQKLIDDKTENEDKKDILNFFIKGNIIKYDAGTGQKIEKNLFDNVKNSSVDIDGNTSDIEKIKTFLDACLDVLHFIKAFHIYKNDGGKEERLPVSGVIDESFIIQFENIYKELTSAVNSYNKIRNYVTKKPYSTSKIRLMFDCPTLLSGWDLNKETSNHAVLLRKENKYYLGILDKKYPRLFDFVYSENDSAKKKKEKKDLAKIITPLEGEDFYEKVAYKFLDIGKQFPRVFCPKKDKSIFNPSEEIRNSIKSKDIEEQRKWIDYCKASLQRHKEWSSVYGPFIFSDTMKYKNKSEFYEDIASCFYKLNFDKVKASYISKCVAEGQLYLFEIYNKDFSSYSHGKENLHTTYFKLLFSEENKETKTFRLSGGAEMFWREASLKNAGITHSKNTSLPNKNPDNPKKTSVFPYDLLKDKRFHTNKYFLHIPLQINYLCGKTDIEQDVLSWIKQSETMHIIGVDRGENNLLYYSVIDLDGKIIEQGSLNNITNTYINKDKQPVSISVNYKDMLENKERERDVARKSWIVIENIKELKSGYLSNIVHFLAQRIIKYQAIVVLENLNIGFKRGRFKVERQVYQKFEKALIDKLNYLVFKDGKANEAGHYLQGYQLTQPFKSLKTLQNGILFYVPAGYTSKIDPGTGFVNTFKAYYENIDKAKKFISDNIISAYFNKKEDCFEFRTKNNGFDWVIYSYGRGRTYYSRQENKNKVIDVNEELKKLFSLYSICYENGADLKEEILKQKQSDFYKRILFLFNVLIQLRYKNDNEDFILSPVKNNAGLFFDSRVAGGAMPKDADANGAFHIALKGLMKTKSIKAGKEDFVKNEDWFKFAHDRNA